MTITVDGFREVLDILRGLFSGWKFTAGLTEVNRREMRDALADMAELIDQTLTIVRQRLATILSELKFGDEAIARKMVYELGDFRGWEERYRRLRLYEALQTALDNMQRSGIFSLKNRTGRADGHIIHQKLHNYVGSEPGATRLIVTMLAQLPALADAAKYTRDSVISALGDAEKAVLEWRQEFFDLEQQIRSAI